MSMRTTPLLSLLELAILSAVRTRPRSGYEIRKSFTSSPVPLGDSPGAVYPALRRLRKAGLLESERDPSSARAKEVFHVTAGGRRALQNAASAPITTDEVSREPERLLLRITILDDAQQRELLRDYMEKMREQAARLRSQSSTSRAESLQLDYAAAMCAARGRWAERMIKSI